MNKLPVFKYLYNITQFQLNANHQQPYHKVYNHSPNNHPYIQNEKQWIQCDLGSQ